jgi:tripartite-type tricarboxylate transporter receptor subunit TctC
LNREVGAILDDADMRTAFAKNGIEAEASSPAALGARIRADVKKWRDVITSAGIRAN